MQIKNRKNCLKPSEPHNLLPRFIAKRGFNLNRSNFWIAVVLFLLATSSLSLASFHLASAQSTGEEVASTVFLPFLSGGRAALDEQTLKEMSNTQAVAPSPSTTGATISTDQTDYPPGATVTLTGTHWKPSEVVHIFVNDDSSNSWTHDSNPDPVADDNGDFTYQFQLPNWFVASYSVIATGSAGSGVATTNFTDLSIGAYDQCSNDDGDGYGAGDTGCRWVNGNLQNNNSTYFEGDATVQRLWLTGFAPGTQHSVTFKYGTTKGGKHAYDFLTTWNWSENWITLDDRCQDITGCSTASETMTDIPGDPNVPNTFEPTAPGSRQFVMRGGTLNSAAIPTMVSGSYAGDSETVITVNFTVANSGSMCPTTGPNKDTCSVAIWFGAHVARSDNWIPIDGAGGATTISGSPYHVALDQIDGVSIGQRDNQMQAGAIIPNGTIVIIKDTVPNDAQDFSFNLTNGTTVNDNFSLDDDADGTLPNNRSFSVPPGAYTAIELNIPSGWSPTNLVCVDPTSNTTVNVTTATASINLASSETVTCTYTNSRDIGNFKITKQTSNPDGATLPAAFTGTYDCGTGYTGTWSVADGGSQTVSGIPTGNICSVTEDTLASINGYTWGTPTFTPVSIVISSKGGTFEIMVGNSITRDVGNFKITKQTSNPDGATLPATFTGTYDCGAGYTGPWSVADGGSQTVSGIPTGNTCSVTEDTLASINGYTWGTPTFTPASIVISSKGGTFEIVVGNSITRDRGSLTIVKKVINDNGGTATMSAFGVATSAGSLTFDSGTINGTTTTYSSQKLTVVTGSYTIKENDVYGYSEGYWYCTGAAGTVVPTFNNGSVVVGKDEDVTCTITNDDQPGTIVIIKNAKPQNGTFSFSTTGSTSGPGTSWPATFTLNGDPTGGGNTKSFTVDAGDYTVNESTQLGWILTGIGGGDPIDLDNFKCTVTGTGGSIGIGTLSTQSAAITLKNGDTVTCVFENTGNGATRTQGFWATHPQLAEIAWFGGTKFGHTFPGVANTTGISNLTLCPSISGYNGTTVGKDINTLGKLMGGFWSEISKKSTGTKRTALDQARMQLLQQLLAAELNASAFGSVPSGGIGMFATWEAAYCGTNQTAIQQAMQGAASFNNSGDSATFTPGTSADSKNARAIANKLFWDILP